jgi:hypothetical protein
VTTLSLTTSRYHIFCHLLQFDNILEQVGILNRTGVPHHGSYDIWTQNRISHLLDVLASAFTCNIANFSGSWVNGNNYQRSKEVFGVLPLPKSQKERLGMHDFNAEFSKATKTRHQYLSCQQNTLVAVLPIHTKPEQALFKALVADLSSDGLFSGKKQPNWESVSMRWSQHADGREIFYKVMLMLYQVFIAKTYLILCSFRNISRPTGKYERNQMLKKMRSRLTKQRTTKWQNSFNLPLVPFLLLWLQIPNRLSNKSTLASLQKTFRMYRTLKAGICHFCWGNIAVSSSQSNTPTCILEPATKISKRERRGLTKIQLRLLPHKSHQIQ